VPRYRLDPTTYYAYSGSENCSRKDCPSPARWSSTYTYRDPDQRWAKDFDRYLCNTHYQELREKKAKKEKLVASERLVRELQQQLARKNGGERKKKLFDAMGDRQTTIG